MAVAFRWNDWPDSGECAWIEERTAKLKGGAEKKSPTGDNRRGTCCVQLGQDRPRAVSGAILFFWAVVAVAFLPGVLVYHHAVFLIFLLLFFQISRP